MEKAEFWHELQTGRQAWDTLLDSINREEKAEVRVEDGWLVKDVVAHVTWFERELVSVLATRAFEVSDLWLLPVDEGNQAIFEENQARPWSAIYTEAKQVGEQLLQAVAALTDEELNNAALFANMPADTIPWQIIAGNSFRHYKDHIETLNKAVR